MQSHQVTSFHRMINPYDKPQDYVDGQEILNLTNEEHCSFQSKAQRTFGKKKVADMADQSTTSTEMPVFRNLFLIHFLDAYKV